MIYRLWSKSFTGRRFADTWGISRDELNMLRDVELVIGPSCTGCLSVMFEIGHQKSITMQLEAHGAVEYSQYKSNLADTGIS